MCLICCVCRVQNHQIELLKDEVTAKDAALVKEHFGHVRAEQECDTLRTDSDQVCWRQSEGVQALQFGHVCLVLFKLARTCSLVVVVSRFKLAELSPAKAEWHWMFGSKQAPCMYSTGEAAGVLCTALTHLGV